MPNATKVIGKEESPKENPKFTALTQTKATKENQSVAEFELNTALYIFKIFRPKLKI